VNDGAISHDDKQHGADCTIGGSAEDFIDIVEGKRNLLTAVLQGRVQIYGDATLAQKFHGLIGSEIEKQRGAA
jgi:putative sterol carrier protein